MKTQILLAATAMLALCACRHSPHADEARHRAAEAAAAVVNTNPADTLAMQCSILDAKAVQSEYALMGDSVAVEIFDEEFQKYVTAHNAKLAGQMFSNGSK